MLKQSISLFIFFALLLSCILLAQPRSLLWRAARKDKIGKVETIDLPELLRLRRNSRIALWDVREPESFRRGHITAAVNSLSPELIATQPIIVVYCDSEFCANAMLQAENLISQRIKPVKVYRNGWSEWASCGLPTEGF